MTGNEKKMNWDRENMRTVSCRLRKEEAEKFKKFAALKGTTAHKLLADYVSRCNANLDAAPVEFVSNTYAVLKENEVLRRKLKIAEEAVLLARERADHADKLVSTWLRSAD